MRKNVALNDGPKPEAALQPQSHNSSKRIRRGSIRIAAAVAALLAMDTARVVFMREAATPVAVASSSAGLVGPRAHVDRDTPLPELFDALRDPNDASAFLKQYLKYELPENPLEFSSTFRTSAKTFLERGSGCCNNFTEFWGELWQATGRKPYIVNMWPTQERCEQRKDEGIKGKGWHMVAVYRRVHPSTGAMQLVIGDNDDVVFWDGSLEEFVQSRGMSILPINGIRPFASASDEHDFRAKIYDLTGPNVAMDISDEPIASPRGIAIAAR